MAEFLDLSAAIPANIWRGAGAALQRQAAFRIARALTRAAVDGRDAVVADLPRRFKLRNGWVAKGIRVEKATPETLRARVYSRDDFMALQETGGVKRGQRGRVAVPLPAARTGPGGIVPRRARPAALRGDRTVFVRQEGRVAVLFSRRGGKAVALFVLVPAARVKPRFGFATTLRRVVPPAFRRHLATP